MTIEPAVTGYLGTALALFLILLRIPIVVALGGVGFAGIILVIGQSSSGDFDLARGWEAAIAFLSLEPFSAVSSFELVAIPMFLLMGFVAFYAGFTRDIFNTARVWMAGLAGGLAMASVVGCAMFAAVSGSSLATASSMGKIAVPEMLRNRYDKGLATGVVAASGTLGALIPPSILMILYGIFTEQSIGRLLLAGLLPGLISALIYMLMIYCRARLNPCLAPTSSSTNWHEKIVSLKSTWAIALLFICVFGSIYSGAATPTESASLGAAGAFLLAFVTKRLSRQSASAALFETVTQVASIFAAIIGAKVFVAFIGLTGIASGLTLWALSLDIPAIMLVMAFSLIYIVLGTVMDPIGIMLLTLPIVVPVVEQLGYDLIWFGVIMVKLLEIGLITPPVGLNVYILKGVVGDSVPLETIFKGISWFLLMDVLTLTLLISFPQISLWLAYSL